jgi:hypothetical protein
MRPEPEVQPESLRNMSLLRRGAGSNGSEQGFVLGLILLGGFECGLAFVVEAIGIGSVAKEQRDGFNVVRGEERRLAVVVAGVDVRA